MKQLSFGHYNGINHFLKVRVSCFGVAWDFADIVHGLLHFEDVPFLFPLDYEDSTDDLGHRGDVQQEFLSCVRGDQDRRVS